MNSYSEDAMIFKALADESRLRIIEILQGGERCACHLLDVLTISQSTLSHHMKILGESGLVSARKEGKWVHYAISEKGVKEVVEMLMRRTFPDIEGHPLCNCRSEKVQEAVG